MHQTHPIAALIVAVLGVGGFVSLSIWLERERRKQVEEILLALSRLEMQTLMLWPNIDAGADHISKARSII